MKKVIVKTQDLKKYYQTGNQTVRALDGVNFEVAEREFVSIIEKSGSGKSTLLHMIGGLDTPSNGNVVWWRTTACSDYTSFSNKTCDYPCR